MKVEYRKRFLKDLAEIPSETRSTIEAFVFNEILSLSSISASGKIEKMSGYKNAYKIRFGEYRLGLLVEGNKIIFQRALHRKEIYRFFP